jgi:hypothetical protein
MYGLLKSGKIPFFSLLMLVACSNLRTIVGLLKAGYICLVFLKHDVIP